MTTPLPVSNRDARRLVLALQGLAEPRHRRLDRQGLYDLIWRLGYVQLDSIATVERAHHLILFSRYRTYRPRDLERLLSRDRLVFEHWTHDACVIPSCWYRYWLPRFARRRTTLMANNWFRERIGEDAEGVIARVRDHVAENGLTRSRELSAAEEDTRSGPWWGWGPAKSALEYLWHTGEIAVARRDNFQKIYDIAERVIPAEHQGPAADEHEEREWACSAALDRLGFATQGELARYFDAFSPDVARLWIAENRHRLMAVEIEGAPGRKPRMAWAWADVEERLADAPTPLPGLRLLAPFDPIVRDRKRAEHLFGFDYRFEAFVPAPKRQYGYYVLPILEGDRLTGRADLKTDRQASTLALQGLWWEAGVKSGAGRRAALAAELARLARFVGVERVLDRCGGLEA
ncbi:MAG: winged helix DNA-binding domain-containing protein [Proteobacteria bacterium]|nr:winged helix DNA-binding domain-containing protein [Pseudomonadota bacterium]MDA1072882.1 winged helix DNA-binding domain-containing protein [Pseudomonadota bacterium]